MRNNCTVPYKTISDLLGIVSECQVHAIASQEGYGHYVAIQKPYLQPWMIQEQLDWAYQNLKRQWELVIWSDKFTIEMGEQTGPLMVTWKSGEAYLPECLELTH